ncbi:MAG: pentapeptide repeat-containing protein [Candidatus Azobacteroides sp.]|nr:pentapeptide repeat-containing protein [Candidatus Azobacteroides sp.]
MIENKTIEKVNFNEAESEEEYYQCTFRSCDFSNKIITDVHFEKCEFILCNFSLSKLKNSFREVKFTECKMTGTDFTGIGKFSLSFCFEKSNLAYASFVGLKLKSTSFAECNLTEAYFDETDLTSSVFDRCELLRTSFYRTNLEKVDLSASWNFTIDPAQTKLKKTIFSERGLRGLVAHLDIIIEEY